MYSRSPVSSGSASARFRSQAGFALLVTIVLVAFLVLIVVGLATFTRVETQVAANSQNLAQARQNALFALNVALGQLQKTAGPDQRITATAEFGNGAAAIKPSTSETDDYGAASIVQPVDGTRHWTSVWGHYTDDSFDIRRPVLLNWLVSGNQSANFTYAQSSAGSANVGEITEAPQSVAPVKRSATSTLLSTPETIAAFSPAAPIRFLPNAAVAGSTTLDQNASPFGSFTLTNTSGTAVAAALLVGPNTAGNQASDVPNYVLAPIETIDIPENSLPGFDSASSTARTVGRYAWWVGDEGVKARVNIADPLDAKSAALPAGVSAGAEARRLRVVQPVRSGAEAIANLSALFPAPDSTGASSQNRYDALERILSTDQIAFNGVALGDARSRFHDITTHSVGLLTNTAAGGLKKDLTFGLLNDDLSPGNQIFTPPSHVSIPSGTVLPKWRALKNFLTADGSTAMAPRAGSATEMALHPVVLRMQMGVFPTANTDSPNPVGSIDLLYMPLVVLWNPYDVTLGTTNTNYTFVFKTRSRADIAANYSLANFPTVAGQAIAPATTWATGNGTFLSTSGGGLEFTIDCPPLAPGEAVFFTLDSNIDTTTTPRVLKPGLTRKFIRETLTMAPVLANMRRTNIALAFPHNLESDCEFKLGSDTLQRIAGVRWWNPARSNTTVNIGGTTFYSMNGGAATAVRRSPGTGDFQPPRGTTEHCLSLQFYAVMEGSREESTVADLVNGQATGRWLANSNPRAPEIDLTAVDGHATDSTFRSPALFGQGVESSNNLGPHAVLTNHDNSGNSASMFKNFYNAFPNTTSNNYNCFVGAPNATDRCVLFHVPRDERDIISIAALQHANLHELVGSGTNAYTPSATQAYAIGNSFADPRTMPNNRADLTKVHLSGYADWSSLPSGFPHPFRNNRAFHFDASYVLNETLWDGYFLSTIRPADTPSFPLRNTRLSPYNPTLPNLNTTLKTYDRSASRLVVEGSFNVNSVSVDAWAAILSATYGVDPNTSTPSKTDEVIFPRIPSPTGSRTDSGTALNSNDAHTGFRGLTPGEVRNLATEIVKSVRLYGPFPTLSQFVNRNPAFEAQVVGFSAWGQFIGPLQAAIDRSNEFTSAPEVGDNSGVAGSQLSATSLTGINDTLRSQTAPATVNTATSTRYFTMLGANGRKPATDERSRSAPRSMSNAAANAPTVLSQADVLQVIGPILSARSDTFRIRTYGEMVNPVTNETEGRAWCEAIVQRLPDFVDSAANEAWDTPAAGSVNQRFGRRFHVVSFRWLNPDDI